MYNNSGALVAQYEYDAWGNTLSVTDASGNEITAWYNIANANPIRYRGYYYDSDLGLYYLQSRYYDSDVGRFINADNQFSGIGGLIQGNNMFAYCINNPVNLSDNSGNWPKWAENIVKVASVVAVVAASVAVIAATTAFTAGTGTAAAVFVSSVALSAALSGINGGVANERSGNSYTNGYLGGATSGATQAVASRLPGGTIWGGAAGTGMGTAITLSLNNLDPDSQTYTKSQIKSQVASSTIKATVTSCLTSVIGAGVGGIDYRTDKLYGGVSNGCNGLMPSLSLGFGEGVKAFFGWVDDAIVYIWE